MNQSRSPPEHYSGAGATVTPVVVCLFVALFSTSCSRTPTLKSDAFAFEKGEKDSDPPPQRIIQLPSFQRDKQPVKGSLLAERLVRGEAFIGEVEITFADGEKPPDNVGILIKRSDKNGGQMVLASGGLKRKTKSGNKVVYYGICRPPQKTGEATLYIRAASQAIFSCPVIIDAAKDP